MANASLFGNRTRSAIGKLLVVGVLSLIVSPMLGTATVLSAEPVNALENGVAMDGFDVVAYFEQGAPVKGEEAHQVRHKGKTWYFSSADNAAAFAAEPETYEPQFNGWCAYAVSEGYGAEVDFVEGWVVLDDKLYLNWNEETKNDFVAEQETRTKKATASWPDVRDGMIDGSIELYRHEDYPEEGISHPQQAE